jgi:hypothetical protein
MWIAAALAGGCSVQSSPTPANGSTAACSLVPDMDQLVGRPQIGSPSGYTIEGKSQCIWTYEADPSQHVSLTVGPVQTHGSSIDAFGAGQSVAGLGDDARWWPQLHGLSVARGDRAFQVNLALDETDASQDLAVSIARSVVEHLP